jgi:hypothetical protein
MKTPSSFPRAATAIVALGSSALLVSSCALPLTGGLLCGAILLAVIFLGALLFPSGCRSVMGPCLSLTSSDRGAAASQPQTNPRLAPDSGNRRSDARLRPCLTILPSHRGHAPHGKPSARPRGAPKAPSKKTIRSQKSPRLGPCLSEGLHVCLSIDPDSTSHRLEIPSPLEERARSRAAIIDRLTASGTISSALAERLRRISG